jgi:sugar phosphate isomerase/epimerase
MTYNRRNFIKGMAATVAVVPFSNLLIANDFTTVEKKKFPISFFTKPLDGYELEFMTEALALAGIDGFDLAVRQKGRVVPESVADDLPKVIEMGKKYKLHTEMMVTAITDAKDEFAELTLKTSAKEGIKHYRLGYYDYDFKKGIPESLNEIRKKLRSLADLNEKIGIQAGYQNHSGIRVGAPMWDVWELIKDLPVENISSQFDIRHAVCEANASWIIAQRLLSKNIGSLAIKDFTWEVSNHKSKVVSTPLGEGIVDFDLFFQTIKDLNIVAPITLHVEYPFLSSVEEKLPLLQKQKVIVSKLKKDTDFIRSKLNKFQLL